MLTTITQQKIPEIERHLEALKAADREGDIEQSLTNHLLRNIKKRDAACPLKPVEDKEVE